MSSYDFRSLSSRDFEELTRDLLQAKWGVFIESFKDGKDQGIDLRYTSLKDKNIIIQCKHYAKSGYKALLRNLKNTELSKVKALSPNRYVLITSIPLSPRNKSEIINLFNPFILVTSDIFGQNDINNLLARHPDVETNHHKLWLTSVAVMNRVLHNAAMVKSEFRVDIIIDKLPLYVQTSSLNKAKRILSEHNFIIISGIPGIGKTTLAEILIYLYLEQGYALTHVTDNINEALGQFVPTQKQVFYYDDFLGKTTLQNRLDKNEDVAIMDFIGRIRKSRNHRLIMTTREYIFQSAKLKYEMIAHGDFELAKMILDLPGYTRTEKARILYNHLYYSKFSANYIDEILQDNFFYKLIDHRNYSPRIIEWMTSQQYVRHIPAEEYGTYFMRTLDNPKRLWEFAFNNQIETYSRILLLALYSLKPPVNIEILREAFSSLQKLFMERFGGETSPNNFKSALQELEGTFTKTYQQSVDFQSASVLDFLEHKLSTESEYIELVLTSATYFCQVANILYFSFENNFDLAQKTIKAAIYRNIKNPEFIFMSSSTEKTFTQNDINMLERVLLLTKLFNKYGDLEYYDWANQAITVTCEAFKKNDYSYGFVIDVKRLMDLILSLTELKGLTEIQMTTILQNLEPLLSIALETVVSLDEIDMLNGAIESHVYLARKYRNIVEEKLRDYLDFSLEDERFQLDNSHDLFNLADTLEKMSEKFSIDTNEHHDNIFGQAAELEAAELEAAEQEAADQEADSLKDEWSGQIFEKQIEEQEIKDMFDSLKNRQIA